MTLRVLIVDDAISVRETMRAIIEAEGMSVAAEARNGREAIARYREVRPDVVTMDLVMPEMSGTEAAREILRFDSRALIIAVSGLSQPTVMAEAELVGCRGFLPKPFDGNELLRELRAISS